MGEDVHAFSPTSLRTRIETLSLDPRITGNNDRPWLSVLCLKRCDICRSPTPHGSSIQRVTLARWGSWSGHMYRDWISLLIFFGICFVVGASGSAFTARSVKTWYPGLLKPTGTPPPWVFGPVW